MGALGCVCVEGVGVGVGAEGAPVLVNPGHGLSTHTHMVALNLSFMAYETPPLLSVLFCSLSTLARIHFTRGTGLCYF
jgi:hypothetical protein